MDGLVRWLAMCHGTPSTTSQYSNFFDLFFFSNQNFMPNALQFNNHKKTHINSRRCVLTVIYLCMAFFGVEKSYRHLSWLSHGVLALVLLFCLSTSFVFMLGVCEHVLWDLQIMLQIKCNYIPNWKWFQVYGCFIFRGDFFFLSFFIYLLCVGSIVMVNNLNRKRTFCGTPKKALIIGNNFSNSKMYNISSNHDHSS